MQKKKNKFYLSEIKANGSSNGKCPKGTNSNAYLTETQFKTFKKITIDDYITQNINFIFPLSLWKTFAYLQQVKFGDTFHIDTVLKNQIYDISRNITVLYRNDVCGHYKKLIEMKNKKNDKLYKIITNNSSLTIAEILDIYGKDGSFLNLISDIFFIVFIDEKITFSWEYENFKKMKIYYDGVSGEMVDSELSEMILKITIKRNNKNLNLSNSEKQEANELKKIIKDPIYTDTNKISDTINDYEKKTRGNSSNRKWKIFDIIFYQLITDEKQFTFKVNPDNNIEEISLGTEMFVYTDKKGRKKRKTRDDINESINKSKKTNDIKTESQQNSCCYFSQTDFKNIVKTIVENNKKIMRQYVNHTLPRLTNTILHNQKW